MNRKQKIQYIWDYYKFHIFGGLFLVYVIISLLNFLIINPPKKIVSRIIIFEADIDKEKVNILENYLNTTINKNPEKTEIDLEIWDLKAPLGLDIKLKAMVAAGMVDGLITGKSNLDYYKGFEMFNPINETDEVAISLSDSKLAEGIVKGQEVFIGLIANSKRKIVTKAVFNELTDIKLTFKY